jgi:Phospholipase_D-nuclease N-terminal
MLLFDYTFFDAFWSMIVFFLWLMWFWLLFAIWTDIFRRDDISGARKALWLIFTIVLPFLGVLIYVIAENDGMTERNIERSKKAQRQFDERIRETAGSGGAAAEIEKGKVLLDSGAITQAEFDTLKANALG